MYVSEFTFSEDGLELASELSSPDKNSLQQLYLPSSLDGMSTPFTSHMFPCKVSKFYPS